MKRFAFKMYLKKGCEKEYAKRHAAIWPELKQMIKDQVPGFAHLDRSLLCPFSDRVDGGYNFIGC